MGSEAVQQYLYLFDQAFEGSRPQSLLGNLASVEWLRAGHARLRERIAALDDTELARPRKTNWDAMQETRWIIRVMIEHDLYHAGEINHVRALLQQNDG